MGHIKIRRPPIPSSIQWIVWVSLPTGSFPGTAVQTAAELVFAKELESVRKAPRRANVQCVESAVHVCGGEEDGRQNGVQLGIDQILIDDPQHLAAQAA